MENLQETIENIIAEHGAESLLEALQNHTVAPFGNKQCPKGYVLVDNQCKLDIGN